MQNTQQNRQTSKNRTKCTVSLSVKNIFIKKNIFQLSIFHFFYNTNKATGRTNLQILRKNIRSILGLI